MPKSINLLILLFVEFLWYFLYLVIEDLKYFVTRYGFYTYMDLILECDMQI